MEENCQYMYMNNDLYLKFVLEKYAALAIFLSFVS